MFESFNENTENLSTGGGIPLYCGPMMFRPTLINPTRAQMNEFLGTDKKTDEISYFSSDNSQGEQVDSLRITFCGYLTKPDGTEFKYIMDPFFLKNKKLISSKDPSNPKSCYLNSFGRTAWTSDINSTYEGWYRGSYRQAIYSEPQLMDFMINLMGINTFYQKGTPDEMLPSYIRNGETFLDIEALFNKDYSSIQTKVLDRFCTEKTDIDPKNPNYKRKICAMGLVKMRSDKDGNESPAQWLYPGKFGRVSKDANGVYKIVKSDVNQIKRDLNNSNFYDHIGIVSDTLEVFDPKKTPEDQIKVETDSWE